MIDSPISPFSEAVRAIRTSALLARSSKRLKTILITSALGGEGKTTFAFNLGVAFAQQNARVLLIDSDLRNPDLHRLFGVPVSPGLSEWTPTQSSNVEGVVRHASLPTLFMLPAGKPVQLPVELFGSLRFEELLEACLSRFDYILIDSPPLLSLADSLVLATRVDAVIGVLRSHSTPRSVVSAFREALTRTRTPVLGFVLNDVQHPTLDGFQEYSYQRK